MALLPRSPREFSDPRYWERFFALRGERPFEWYAEWEDVAPVVKRYLKPGDQVLLPGCGTSDLPSGLLTAGVGGVTGLECSANAVTTMQRRHKGDARAHFLHLDATATGLPDGKFQVCLDKGTFDAIMADSSDSCRQTALSYLAEMERLLQHGGRFLCITLAQHHVLGALTQMFAAGGWALRFHDLTVKSTASVGRRGPAPPPVFVAVATKLRLIPFASAPCLLEVWAEGMEQPGRCADGVAMETWVRERQDYAAIRSQLSDLGVAGGPKCEISLELWSTTTPSHPRYSLYIVDTMSHRDCTCPEKMFAVFIVPHGRERESLFGSEAGRAQLAKNAGFSRLIIVLLLPGQDYGGVSGEETIEGGSRLEVVQKELSPRMLELAPAGIPPGIKIPFLSVGVGVGWREVRFRGRSDLSGEFLVEDVGSTPEDMTRPCHIYRRLVFLGSQNLLQSETRFVSAPLWRVVVVGLGGGALSRFLTHRLNSQLSLVTVEIDQELVSVAVRWFGFLGDVVLGDGVQYVHWLAAQGHQIDALLIDADSKDMEGGLSCPPPDFLSLEFLSVARHILMPGGILSLNLVTRDPKVRSEAVSKLVKAFPAILSFDIPGLTNEVIACLPCGLSKRKVRGNRVTKEKEANNVVERWGCDTGIVEGVNASPLKVDRVPQLVRAFEDRLKKAGPLPAMDLVDVASHLHVIK
uniref:eEF1A lysine and N-terminal methyltransferase n=1 Tax=Eptatretus burgeri TaxID=7764 RepID=A0A8C4QPQ6_EPTBU